MPLCKQIVHYDTLTGMLVHKAEARREEQARLQARLEELASSLTAQSLRHDAVAAPPAQIRSFLKDV